MLTACLHLLMFTATKVPGCKRHNKAKDKNPLKDFLHQFNARAHSSHSICRSAALPAQLGVALHSLADCCNICACCMKLLQKL